MIKMSSSLRMSRALVRIGACATGMLFVSTCAPHDPAQPPAALAPAPVASTPVGEPAPTEPAAPRIVTPVPDAEAPPAVASLPATIDLAIERLRNRDYRGLIEQLVDPEDLAKIQARGKSVDSLVRAFGDSKKPRILLAFLLSIRGQAPELSGDGTEATFRADPDAGAPDRRKLRFRRVNGRWYLRND